MSLHRRIWALAWPLLLSNLTAPLLGLVDTTVVGHLDSPAYLAAVALGSNFFMFLYFSFNFLRMGTTGFAAQQHGRGRPALLVLARALVLAILLGGLLIAINPWLRDLALQLLGGGAEVRALAADYINMRILGAPAVLANFALIGFAIGIHRSRVALKMAILMNGSNAVLSYLLVYGWPLDVRGVAAASAIAAWLGTAGGLFWLRAELFGVVGKPLSWRALWQVKPMLQLMALNRDLFIRSLVLLSVFFFFTAQGARLGDTILAANAVLLTFFMLLSNTLDGFANAAEALVGEALGSRHRGALRRVVRATGQWTLAVALLVLAAFAAGGVLLIDLLTDLPTVRSTAIHFLPWMLLMPVTASAGFWLDGLFVGATRAADMRNTMLAAVVVFFVLWWLTRSWGNNGLWLAMNGLMASRGLMMGGLWWRRPPAGPV